MTETEKRIVAQPGVQVQTTFGWRYISIHPTYEAAERAALDARETGRYLAVRVN